MNCLGIVHDIAWLTNFTICHLHVFVHQATSALDSVSERLVQDALERLMKVSDVCFCLIWLLAF